MNSQKSTLEADVISLSPISFVSLHNNMYLHVNICVDSHHSKLSDACLYIYLYIHVYSFHRRLSPPTKEIGLKRITTAKISNKFARHSPYISNTFSRESPTVHTSFHVCKRSPRHSKDLTTKSLSSIRP